MDHCVENSVSTLSKSVVISDQWRWKFQLFQCKIAAGSFLIASLFLFKRETLDFLDL